MKVLNEANEASMWVKSGLDRSEGMRGITEEIPEG